MWDNQGTTGHFHPDDRVRVCVDCYFTHIYGAYEYDGLWYAGDSDTPATLRPLRLLVGLELADTGEDPDTFDPWPCEGCGCQDGGERHTLAYRVASPL